MEFFAILACNFDGFFKSTQFLKNVLSIQPIKKIGRGNPAHAIDSVF
jgi:hypothetical protein